MATLNITINPEPAVANAKAIGNAIWSIGKSAKTATTALERLEIATASYSRTLAAMHISNQAAINEMSGFFNAFAAQNTAFQRNQKEIRTAIAKTQGSIKHLSNEGQTHLTALGTVAKKELGSLAINANASNDALRQYPRVFRDVNISSTSALGGIKTFTGGITKMIGTFAISIFLIGEMVMIFWALQKAIAGLMSAMKGDEISKQINEIVYQFDVLKSQVKNIIEDVVKYFGDDLLQAMIDLNLWIASNKQEIIEFLKDTVKAIQDLYSAVKEVIKFLHDNPIIVAGGIVGYIFFGKAGSAALAGILYAIGKINDEVLKMAIAVDMVAQGAASAQYFLTPGFSTEFNIRFAVLGLKDQAGTASLEESLEYTSMKLEVFKKKLHDLGEKPVIIKSKPVDIGEINLFSGPSGQVTPGGTALSVLEEDPDARVKLKKWEEESGKILEDIRKLEIEQAEIIKKIAEKKKGLSDALTPDIDSEVIQKIYKDILTSTGVMVEQYYNILIDEVHRKATNSLRKIQDIPGMEKVREEILSKERWGVFETWQKQQKGELKILDESFKTTKIAAQSLYEGWIEEENRRHKNFMLDANTEEKQLAEMFRHRKALSDIYVKSGKEQINIDSRRLEIFDKMQKAYVFGAREEGINLMATLFGSKDERETVLVDIEKIDDATQKLFNMAPVTLGDRDTIMKQLFGEHDIALAKSNYENLIAVGKSHYEALNEMTQSYYESEKAMIESRHDEHLIDDATYYKEIADLKQKSNDSMLIRDRTLYELSGYLTDEYYEKRKESIEGMREAWMNQYKDAEIVEARIVKELIDLWNDYYKSRSNALKQYESITGKSSTKLYELELMNIEETIKKLKLLNLTLEEQDEIRQKLYSRIRAGYLEGQDDLAGGFEAGLRRIHDEIEPWGKTVSNAMVNVAHDMYNAFDDFFFNMIEGRFVDMNEMAVSLGQYAKKALAGMMAESTKKGFQDLVGIFLPGFGKSDAEKLEEKKVSLLEAIESNTAAMAGRISKSPLKTIIGQSGGERTVTTTNADGTTTTSVIPGGGQFDLFDSAVKYGGKVVDYVKDWVGGFSAQNSGSGMFDLPAGTSHMPYYGPSGTAAPAAEVGLGSAIEGSASSAVSQSVRGASYTSSGAYMSYLQAPVTAYSIWKGGQGQSRANSAMSGAFQGGMTGASIGTAILPGYGTAVGAAVGLIVGGVMGLLAGTGEKKFKAQMAAGEDVQTGRPYAETPFGKFGFTSPTGIDTDPFKDVMSGIETITQQMASTMSDAMVENVTAALSGWKSKIVKGGAVDPQEVSELIVDYFQVIGATWGTEFGLWIAEFEGSLEGLMSGIGAHLEVMHTVMSIIDPVGTEIQDVNMQFDTMRRTLESTGGSAKELSQLEQARGVKLGEIAQRQQEIAEAEYERYEAEMKRLRQLQQAYREFQISLMPEDVQKEVRWGMIQKRWGTESGMPTGVEAKAIIDALARDPQLVNRMMSMGEDEASQFQTDVGFIKGIADEFDNLVLSVEEATESVLDNVSAAEEINRTWDSMAQSLIDVGYEGELLTTIEAARTKQLSDLADEEQKIKDAEFEMFQDINIQTAKMIGMFNELEIAQMDLTDTFMGFWDQIKETDGAMELFPILAERYGIALEKLNKQFEASYYSALAALPGLSASKNKQFATSAIASKYGLSGSDITGGMISNLYGLASSGQFSYDQVRQYLDTLGFKEIDVSEFIGDIGALHDIYFPQLESSTSGASDALNKLEQAANEWRQVIENVKDDIERMMFTESNPQNVLERMELVRAAIKDLGVIDTPEEAEKAREYYNTLLELGKEAYQRPTMEYQNVFDEVLAGLKGLQTTAESEEVKLLRLIEENTRNTIVATLASGTAVSQTVLDAATVTSEFFSRNFNDSSSGTPASGTPASGTLTAWDIFTQLLTKPPSYNASSDLDAMMDAQPYQHGGVFTDSVGLATLHGPEAVIPLKNGAVPVELTGGGETVVHITVAITGDTNPAETRRQARAGVIEALKTPEAQAVLKRHQRWGT